MINNSEFRIHAHEFVDWMADFLETIDELPVKSKTKPGEIISQLPKLPPQEPELIETIFNDFKSIILPGITNWQSPNFFAYFPANSSYPSLLAEMLTATLGAQCMVWETSPAAAELEELVLNWLKKMTGIPEFFHGVIQDTASTATLVALLTARERASKYKINQEGFTENRFRIYCSTETHSSIEKGVKIAGIGKESLVKIPVDSEYRMNSVLLEDAIMNDLNKNLIPTCIVASIGTTGSTAIDPLKEIAEIASKYSIWLHVDAAFAGTALLLDEFRWMIDGIEEADSFVFNPHKWMFTNFDCSVYYVKDKEALINTFSINPEYLKTKTAGQVNDYRDWGIQLGRRFRALKLWFVIRNYGVTGLQEKLREHILLAKEVEKWIEYSADFEMITPRTLNLVCFRYHPSTMNDEEKLNRINEQLLDIVNKSGKVFLSHTKLNGKYTLRMVIGQTHVERKHIEQAWKFIKTIASEM